jgi:glycosyltransferase involved in cell wall biosynthesis
MRPRVNTGFEVNVKVAIYNLHFATLGGGERRSALLAAHLCHWHDVTLFVHSPLNKSAIREIFGIDLSKVMVVELDQKDHLEEVARVRPDIFINNSHGSQLPCIAPVGIYMCMFPEGEKFDLSSYDVITANSNFTAKWLLKKWGYTSEVVYSACEFIGTGSKKEKIILNVARFFEDTPSSHHKRQDVLIEAFRKLVDEYEQDWQLHLVGNVGVSPGDQTFVEHLRFASERYPVQILTGLNFDLLRQEYRNASIYWHATGFGFREDDRPSKQEHFGMSIIEAMSAGAVPLAFDGGGPRESIRPGVNGYLWTSKDELIHHTRYLASNAARMECMSAAAVEDSKQFGAGAFLARMDAIITRLTSAQF